MVMGREMAIYRILSSIGLNASEYEPIIDEIAETMKRLLHYILIKGVDIFVYILRPLYIILIVYGLIKYTASGMNQRNRNVLVGGVILAAFTEGILPIILQYLK